MAGWKIALLMAATATLGGTSVNARKATDNAAREQMDQVRLCKAIADPAARVACYDRAAGEPAARSSTPSNAAAASAPVIGRLPGGARVVTKADDPARAFGLEEVKEGRPQRERREPTQAINARVTGIVSSKLGYDTFALDNGSRWQMTELTEMRLPKVGDVVTIRRGAVGGYFLNLTGKSSVRVTRRL